MSVIDHEFEDGDTLLIKAIDNHQLALAQALIDQGADVNFHSRVEGVTPMSCAIGAGFCDMVQLLLKRGVIPSTEDCSDACWHGQPEILACLIQAGAPLCNLDVVATNGKDYMRVASQYHGKFETRVSNRAQCAAILLQRGARNLDPVYEDIVSYDVLRILLAHGVKIDQEWYDAEKCSLSDADVVRAKQYVIETAKYFDS